MSGFDGSSSTWRSPRGAHGVAFAATRLGSALAQSAAFAEPPWMYAQLLPPSVDL